jgi:hypothetical protein
MEKQIAFGRGSIGFDKLSVILVYRYSWCLFQTPEGHTRKDRLLHIMILIAK